MNLIIIIIKSPDRGKAPYQALAPPACSLIYEYEAKSEENPRDSKEKRVRVVRIFVHTNTYIGIFSRPTTYKSKTP